MFIPHPDLFVKTNDNIDLYVIGYENQGESIILNVANQFVGVIDSYKTNENFITKEIIEEIGKKELNFICWTHTDEDHSKGLSELFQYVDNNTVLLIPDGISVRKIKDSLTGQSGRKEYHEIFNLIDRYIETDNFIAVNQSSGIYSFNLKFRENKTGFLFQMEAFSPLAKQVRDKCLNTIHQINDRNLILHEDLNNIYSISLTITLVTEKYGSIKICLTGDLDNETIKQIKTPRLNEIFNENFIFKIPHHCSLNSDEIVNRGSIISIGHAVTTCFKKGNLPNTALLNKYKNYSETVSRTNATTGSYGYVHYSIPISNPHKVVIKHIGSAGIA